VESVDLETAEAKRQKMAPPVPTITTTAAGGGSKTNLDKNKSKSMMSVTSRTAGGAAVRGAVFSSSVVDPELFFRIRIPFSVEFWIRILLDH
jgi:hypothetical protein